MTTNHRVLSAQEKADLKSILCTALVGYLAVATGTPYVVPINFVYDDSDDSQGWGRLFFHSGEGRKSRAIAGDPRVCLAVLADAVFARGEGPCDDGFTYRSALVEGRASPVTDAAEQEQALRMIVTKYDPGFTHSPFDERALARTLVYSVVIDTVSLKRRPVRP